MPVPAARPGTWEARMHEAVGADALLLMHEAGEAVANADPLGHRAIGVVYHPERERYGNYVPTILTLRYDALVYLESTSALRPLHMESRLDGEAPETYPSGM